MNVAPRRWMRRGPSAPKRVGHCSGPAKQITAATKLEKTEFFLSGYKSFIKFPVQVLLGINLETISLNHAAEHAK